MSAPASTPPASLLESRDPATGELLGRVRLTPPERMVAEVAASAKVQPLWAQLRLADRARYVRRAAQAVIDEFDEIVAVVAAEQGRPAAEVATLELLAAIDALSWMAGESQRILGTRRIDVHRSLFPFKRARVTYEPLGTVAVIGAGSAPFAQPLTQVAGALLAGNGVVFKPARRSALAGERVFRALTRAGLPEGLLRIVHGGAEEGVALAQAPVAKVLFTGSRATGRQVARAGVSRGTEVALEVGGKDAMLVLADAHVPTAVAGALSAGLAGAGQARGAVERVIVLREVAEHFTSALVSAAGAVRVGDPRVPGTQMGPLASPARREHVLDLVSEAVREGAEVRCGGAMEVPGLSGSFFRPTVVTGVTGEMRIAREPIGGPVLTVAEVDTIDEAIAMANDAEHGLGVSVWTADRYRAHRIATELRCGMVWLNDHLPSPAIASGPWGAAPGVGLGSTLGASGLRACAHEKLITWDPAGTRGLWWRPYDEVLLAAARSVALLRSARDADRERAWRSWMVPVVRVAGRAWGRRGRRGG
jgi:acyl-CoA reductase-like NAD-dependent aldehyde dehydrogenase